VHLNLLGATAILEQTMDFIERFRHHESEIMKKDFIIRKAIRAQKSQVDES
jgi:hypothetical protein